jgi:hypothetical protein
MSDFSFPVFVREKDDGSVIEFSTQVAMQGYLEAIDVDNGEYEAWDAKGRRLELSVAKSNSEWLKIILMEGQASEEEFAALKDRASIRTSYEPLSKRVRRWVGRS